MLDGSMDVLGVSKGGRNVCITDCMGCLTTEDEVVKSRILGDIYTVQVSEERAMKLNNEIFLNWLRTLLHLMRSMWTQVI